MLQHRTFEDVHREVAQRADEALPDHIVHIADLRMTPEGYLTAPHAPTWRLNDWSRRQLAALVGIRWDRWFQSTSGDERAEELNRRLSRLPGERKIRAWRDPTGPADGIARALLSPTFTPIDDVRIFERLAITLKGALAEYRFARVCLTETTTHYTAVAIEPRDLHGDLLHPGWHLRNSEVGAAALSIDDHWLRLVCTNGLMVRVGDKRALYRTHRAIDDDHLAAALVLALSRLPERWDATFRVLEAARATPVPHPDDAVAAALDSAEVPKALVEEARTAVLRDNDATRYGVVQAITWVAHAVNRDPDVRFAMERLAGEYLVAPVPN